MPKNTIVLLFVLTMIALIVGVDILLFKNLFWQRLIANISIVLLFIALYRRYIKQL